MIAGWAAVSVKRTITHCRHWQIVPRNLAVVLLQRWIEPAGRPDVRMGATNRRASHARLLRVSIERYGWYASALEMICPVMLSIPPAARTRPLNRIAFFVVDESAGSGTADRC